MHTACIQYCSIVSININNSSINLLCLSTITKYAADPDPDTVLLYLSSLYSEGKVEKQPAKKGICPVMSSLPIT